MLGGGQSHHVLQRVVGWLLCSVRAGRALSRAQVAGIRQTPLPLSLCLSHPSTPDVALLTCSFCCQEQGCHEDSNALRGLICQAGKVPLITKMHCITQFPGSAVLGQGCQLARKLRKLLLPPRLLSETLWLWVLCCHCCFSPIHSCKMSLLKGLRHLLASKNAIYAITWFYLFSNTIPLQALMAECWSSSAADH